MRIRCLEAVRRMSNDQSNNYHIPVLLKESLEALVIKPDGVYIDATYGGGGHSRPILHRMTAKGRLFGFDQDKQAIQNVLDDPGFTFVNANFQFVTHFMKYYRVDAVDGVLADLGVSSFHFDEPERGFSYRFDTELDMRMNKSATRDAKDILGNYTVDQLQDVFSRYGELRNAKTFSQMIVKHRDAETIRTTGQLKQLIDRAYRGDKTRYTAQVFQALRIEVNDEMNVLSIFLRKAWELLASKGRMAVITYHSVEDKVVKQSFRDFAEGDADEFGRVTKVAKLIAKKPIVPTAEEIRKNSRAASAKLRVIEKL